VARKSSTIGVQLVGKVFPRFILARGDRQYWNGTDWTPCRSQALLYYHLELIQQDRRRLIAIQRRKGNK
jgi:hypothetical protein